MDEDNKLSRRQLIKASGAVSALLGGVGLGMFGYAAGKDPNTYLGWQTHEGANQTFDRAAWEAKNPTYEKVGTTSRPDARTENLFARRGRFMRQYKGNEGLDDFDDVLKAYYREHPEVLELDILNMEEIVPKQRQDAEKYGERVFLAEAWADAMTAAWPPAVSGPPEEADFPRKSPYSRGPTGPQKMRSPEKTAKLVKKIAHELGATLVGITRLNPDWVYRHPLPGRGFENIDEPMEVPAHWEYAVVVGTPMSWDPMFANPCYGTSMDAYARSRIVATRLTAFIHRLGYAARPHTPGNSYDLMVPPICVDAGLGEQGRHSIVITPELGCNFRPAVVTTNLAMKPDKPIDIGVQDFCKHCKICAEQCPSGAISMGGKEEIRGYRRYRLDSARCNNFWNSTLGSMGCRLCVSVCPYTRKANWLHKTAFKVSLHDPTNLSDKVLTKLQKSFYPGQDPQKYYIPSLGGENASYRPPPWWLRTEDFIEFGG